MAKTKFSEKARTIWANISGTKVCLSSHRIFNFVDILGRSDRILLTPVMVRYGDTFKKFDMAEFKLWEKLERKPKEKRTVEERLKIEDGYCTVFYIAEDIEESTGSMAANIAQWSSRLLEYGRGQSHPLAPWMHPPPDVLAALEARGLLGGRIKMVRFYSLEVVMFYLAAQTRTWKHESRILELKEFLTGGHGLPTILFTPKPVEDDVVNDLLGDLNGPSNGSSVGPSNGSPAQVKTTRSRRPKAGDQLVAYMPNQAALAVVASPRPPAPPPPPGPADVVLIPDGSRMSTEEIRIHATTFQRLLEERLAEERTKTNREEAAKSVLVHGAEHTKVRWDRPVYASVVLRYPDGSELIYDERAIAKPAS
jgi:hypothetical protein